MGPALSRGWYPSAGRSCHLLASVRRRRVSSLLACKVVSRWLSFPPFCYAPASAFISLQQDSIHVYISSMLSFVLLCSESERRHTCQASSFAGFPSPVLTNSSHYIQPSSKHIFCASILEHLSCTRFYGTCHSYFAACFRHEFFRWSMSIKAVRLYAIPVRRQPIHTVD